MVRLGVLDQVPVRKGSTASEALTETVELARLAERLGYSRYWVAEHHGSGALASASPEVLIGHIADRTSTIRVGSGGVMLTHYSPLKVAEQFRMLEALHPRRIDLGLGRAPGSDTRTARALAAGGGGAFDLARYPDQLMDLYGYLTGDLPPGHPYAGITASPAVDSMPELWLLGSSSVSGEQAAELGWSFCFAHFIQQNGGELVVRRYREAFQPSPIQAEPRTAIGVSVTCAPTDSEAEYLSWSRWGWRLMGQRGAAGGIPSPEEAMAFAYTDAERDYLEFAKRNSIYGSPETVRTKLEALMDAYGGLDELIVVTITYDFEARKRSYALLAEIFPQPSAASVV